MSSRTNVSNHQAEMPPDWHLKTLADLGEWSGGQTPLKSNPSYWQNGSILWLSPKDMIGPELHDSEDKITEAALAGTRLRLYPPSSIMVVVRSGILRHRFPVARCVRSFTVNQDLKVLVPHEDTDSEFAFCVLSQLEPVVLRRAVKAGTTVESVDIPSLLRLDVPTPPAPQQRKIAKILTTVDKLIEKTEALIAKYQAIKQGMMHDLFTRGVDEHGQLRPPYDEAPELYKESELGWIPREWEVESLETIADSIIDGPFGSNLKTEHYVTEPGVRVVRLQNIHIGSYNDDDRAFVSERHATRLSRHFVVPGDVLVAALGDERHPVGRACCYPDLLPPAINKADCFRLRCDDSLMRNRYAMLSLNSVYARQQVSRLFQGVTRVRVNVQTLKQIVLPLPNVHEQERVVQRIDSADSVAAGQVQQLAKLNTLKMGLVQDLLTGRVRVTVHSEGAKDDF